MRGDDLREAVLGEVMHDRGSEPESGWFVLGVDGYFDVDNACWCQFQDDDAPWTSEHFDLFGTIPVLLDAHPTPSEPEATVVEEAGVIDAAHLQRQREWSRWTFGPGPRTLGVLDHIRKELAEIEAAPDDLTEWVDVIILAFDGAWRAGWEPQQIIDAIKAKQAKNEARIWPDWRTASADHAIEHVRARSADR